MKKMNTLFALLFVSAGVFAQTMWNVDKNHTNIQFNVSHMVVSEVKLHGFYRCGEKQIRRF